MINIRRPSFSDTITSLYYQKDPEVKCPTVTFQVTDDCCLNCSYCYQINKGHRFMSKETIKQGIDLLFQLYDEDNENSIINHHAHGLVIEFIGGEPLMNMETVSYGSHYFLNECLKKNHPWLTNFRFSIGSNGVLFFEKDFQDYLKDFSHFISYNVTIDGPKELHDACRKDWFGNGSFDRAIKAYDTYHQMTGQKPSTKITIAPENLLYLDTIVNFFIEHECDVLYANPIFEHEWSCQESQLYYSKLKIIADHLLNYPNITTNIFLDRCGTPLTTKENSNWCGGTGAMLAFDPEGKAYPCIRFMESSLGNIQPPLQIGSINGLYQTEKEQKIYKDLKNITRRSQSTDECWNCSITCGCGWCSGWNYQKYGTCNKRCTNICWMHRARSLANTYYYNTYYKLNNMQIRIPVYLERNIANKIIGDEEYDQLLQLASPPR